jgi:hypothetical protein
LSAGLLKGLAAEIVLFSEERISPPFMKKGRDINKI